MAVLQWSTIAVFLFYTFIQQTSCDFERRCGLADRLRSPMGVCGSHLSKLMAFVCDGQYQKRATHVTASEPDSWIGHDGGQKEEAMSPGENIFVSKSRALAYLQHKRNTFSDGSTVGIVCECCTYRCSIGEMTQYCKAGGGFHGKRSWTAPTPPHAWLTNAQKEKAADDDDDKSEAEKNEIEEDKSKKITEVIFLTMFPERKTTTE